jgi:hypothetical protein
MLHRHICLLKEMKRLAKAFDPGPSHLMRRQYQNEPCSAILLHPNPMELMASLFYWYYGFNT